MPYHTCDLGLSETANGAGGYAGGISIKVDNMVPACAMCNPGGSIADTFFSEAPLFDEVWAAVWAERDGPQPRPAAGGE
ncbi:MAG TPA: hypothetical protein VLQ90_07400 [Pyrinomonadaceae bacterium]|nr:hypothetical protein [Pyrinomonadaceae bacterium]